MADKKISQLTSASTPLAGTEVLPIVQSGVTKKVSVESVAATTQPSGTANGVAYLNASKVMTTGTALTFSGTNLGVGVASPSCLLDLAAARSIVKNTSTTGTNAVDYRVINTGGTTYFGREDSTGSSFGAPAYATIMYSAGAYPTVFFTNGAESFRADSNNNIQIGTTTSRGRLTAQIGAGSTPAMYSYNNGATSGDYATIFALGDNTNDTSSYYLLCTQPGIANRFAIYGNGTYATLSDQRIKKNIETTRDGYLDDVMRLRVVKYNWLNQKDGDSKELGVIAQELEQVFPGMVQESRAENSKIAYKQIKQSVIPFILLKAIQELKTELDDLKIKLAAVKPE